MIGAYTIMISIIFQLDLQTTINVLFIIQTTCIIDRIKNSNKSFAASFPFGLKWKRTYGIYHYFSWIHKLPSDSQIAIRFCHPCDKIPL